MPAVGKIKAFEGHDGDEKILGEHLNHGDSHYKYQQESRGKNHSCNQAADVIMQVCSPTRSQRQSHGHTDKKREEEPDRYLEDDLPQKKPGAGAMPSTPSIADGTFTAQHAVKQNKTEHAVDVEKGERQHHQREHSQYDQSDELGDVPGNLGGRNRKPI